MRTSGTKQETLHVEVVEYGEIRNFSNIQCWVVLCMLATLGFLLKSAYQDGSNKKGFVCPSFKIN